MNNMVQSQTFQDMISHHKTCGNFGGVAEFLRKNILSKQLVVDSTNQAVVL